MKRTFNAAFFASLKEKLPLIELFVDDLTVLESFILGFCLNNSEEIEIDFLIDLKTKNLAEFFNELRKKDSPEVINQISQQNKAFDQIGISKEEDFSNQLKNIAIPSLPSSLQNFQNFSKELVGNPSNERANFHNNLIDYNLKNEKIEEINENLSKNFIKTMMEEEEKDYKESIELKEKREAEEIVCKICLKRLMEKDYFLLDNCSDIFHRECISFYVKNEIQNGKAIIFCPNLQCQMILNNEELEEFFPNKNKNDSLNMNEFNYSDYMKEYNVNIDPKPLLLKKEPLNQIDPLKNNNSTFNFENQIESEKVPNVEKNMVNEQMPNPSPSLSSPLQKSQNSFENQKAKFEANFSNYLNTLNEKGNPHSFNFIKNNLENEINEEEEEKKEDSFYEDMNEKLSRDFIKKMVKEEEKEYKQLMEMKEEMDEEDMICQICLEGLMKKDLFLLNNCSEIFHQECIASYVKNEIQERKIIIVCPNSKCKVRINIEELKGVLSQLDIENYYKYSLEYYVDTHADDMSWCPTPDCKYAFYKLEGINDYDFHCPLCDTRYCLNCRVIFHDGQTCQEYSISNSREANDVAFENFVQGNKFKQCPKCKFWVEKTQGCDHMVCRCKFQFCYKCGGVYMQCDCPKILMNANLFHPIRHNGQRRGNNRENQLRQINYPFQYNFE